MIIKTLCDFGFKNNYGLKVVSKNTTDGENKMKIDKSLFAFNETLKVADVLNKEFDAKLIDIKPVTTKLYGEKIIAVLSKGKNDKDIQIFLNALSLQNLTESFGDETDEWKNKNVHVGVVCNESTFNKPSILVSAID